jgi:hypothetical protein
MSDCDGWIQEIQDESAMRPAGTLVDCSVPSGTELSVSITGSTVFFSTCGPPALSELGFDLHDHETGGHL